MRRDSTQEPDARTIAAVLQWLECRMDSLSSAQDPWGHHVVREMIRGLRQGAAEGRLELAWTPHGLDEDVGPVMAMFSEGGAVVAYLSGSAARRQGNPERLGADQGADPRPGEQAHPDW